ncbi:uncharacterized protein LOC132612186 [Lycium barbarum]|uniref:uncharacterized protein LOC132612186 n=1 Tax=Lycium barbarum TaxID=112863 RepID=UPI00293EE164|nr:uncharacterized protein LOC132612186 [Lycium barbarum]
MKAEHQRPSGLAQNIDTSFWKWEMINMDFITGLLRSARSPDSIWKGLGTKVNPSTIFHPQTDDQPGRTIQTFEDMLRARVIDFKVTMLVLEWGHTKLCMGTDVDHQSGVMWFVKKGKLSPRYIGPYRILRRFGQVAYELELPQDMIVVHLVFHVSMSRKSVGDPSLVIPTDSTTVNDSLTYEEVPVAILHREVRKVENETNCLTKGTMKKSES